MSGVLWHWLRSWVEFFYWLEHRLPTESLALWAYRERKAAERRMIKRWGSIYR